MPELRPEFRPELRAARIDTIKTASHTHLHMPRSVRLHPDNRDIVDLALVRSGFTTQGALAAHLLFALSTVNNFFRSIKVSVAKFEEICEALALDPKEMMQPARSEAKRTEETNEASTQPLQTRITYAAYDAFWVGRDSLTAELNQKLKDPCRLLLIVGISGIGKTALAERIAESQQTTFAHTIKENFDYREQTTDFSSFAARLLEVADQFVSPEERTQPSQLSQRLLSHLQNEPTLVLIDSLENILEGNEQDGWSEFIDKSYLRFFQAVLAVDSFPSRLILTSQDLPAEIQSAGSRYRTRWHTQPLTGLSEEEQQTLFDKTGFVSEPLLTRIGKAYEGHPLALRTILGEISDRPFFGNVRAYWQRYGQEIEAVEDAIAQAAAGQTTGADDKWQLDRFTRALRRNVQTRLENTLQRLRQDARYAYVLLCEAAVYRCAVPEDWWLSHLEDWDLPEDEQITALDVLRDRYLVEESVDTVNEAYLLKQHNLIRSLSLSHLEKLAVNSADP